MELLVHYLEADKEGSRLRRSVEIARIAEFPFIQVFLETVEDILYTRIQLKLDMVVKHKGVVQLHIQVQELGGMLHAVRGDIAEGTLGSIFRCVVRNNHLSRISAGKGEVEILHRRRGESEISVIVRCTGHALGGKVFAVHLRPGFLMDIAAALRREAELELRLLAVGNLRIQIGTVYACAVSVAALLDDIPYFVLADIFEHKDVAQVCIETLHQDVCLPVSRWAVQSTEPL